MNITRNKLKDCVRGLTQSSIDLQKFPFKEITYECYNQKSDVYLDNGEIFYDTDFIKVLSLVFLYYLYMQKGTQQLSDISNIENNTEFTYSSPHISYFLKNLHNSFYQAGRLIFAYTLEQSEKLLDSKSENAAYLFFILLSVYLGFVLVQSVIGYFLLQTSVVEENLFLSLPNKDCRILQKRCTNFIINSKVFLSDSKNKIKRMFDMEEKKMKKMPIC